MSADGKPLKAFPLQVTQVAPSADVYEVESMMEQVMTHGTGVPALQRPAAGSGDRREVRHVLAGPR